MATISGSDSQARTWWAQVSRGLHSLAAAPGQLAQRQASQMKGLALMQARAANQAVGQQLRQVLASPSAMTPPGSDLSHDAALRRAARQRIRLEGVSPSELPPVLQSAYLRGQQAHNPARAEQHARRELAQHQGDLSALHPAQQNLWLGQLKHHSPAASARLARGHAQGTAAQNAGLGEADRLQGQAIEGFRTATRVATMGASESAIAARQAAGEGRWMAAAGQATKGAFQTAMAATSAPGLGLLARAGLGAAKAGTLAVMANPAMLPQAAGAGLKAGQALLYQAPGLLARAPGAAWNAATQAPAVVATTAKGAWNAIGGSLAAGKTALVAGEVGVSGTRVVQSMAATGNAVDTGVSAGQAVSKGAAGNWSGAFLDGLNVTFSVLPVVRSAAADARAARVGGMPTGVNRMMGDSLADYLTTAQGAAPGGAAAATLAGTSALAQRRLSTAIERACASTDKTVRLEGQAAKAIRSDVVGFQKKVVDPATGEILGEIDVETRHALVEVTTDQGGKTRQLDRYLSPGMNPENKSVVLYSPAYTKAGERHLQNEGYFERGLVALTRTEEQLQRAIDITSAWPRR